MMVGLIGALAVAAKYSNASGELTASEDVQHNLAENAIPADLLGGVTAASYREFLSQRRRPM
jgi:hypothetical protein